MTIGNQLGSLANVGSAQRPQSVYNTSLKVHPAYEVELTVRNSPTSGRVEVIKTFLPESIGIQLGSSWENPYDKSFGDMLGGKEGQAANAAADIAGAPNRSKWMTAMVWKNGQPLQISLPFVFAANENTETDVLSKFRFLSKLVSPDELGAGNSLRSPGPTIAGQVIDSASVQISCRIGNFLFLDNVVVESVDANIDFILDENGKPMYMTFNVTVKTFYSVTKEDIDKMLGDSRLVANGVRNMNINPQDIQNPVKVDRDKV